jgi:archaellum component FlaC
MKFVTRAQTALTTGAAQVAEAVKKASSTLGDELETGLTEGRAAIGSVGQQLAEIPPRLARLPGLLDPRDTLSDLGQALSTLQGDLTGIANSAGQFGSRLNPVVQQFGQTRNDVGDVLDMVRQLPEKLTQAGTPDLEAVRTRAQQTLARGQAMLERATTLPTRLQALAAMLPELRSKANADTLIDTAARQAHADINVLRTTLQDEHAQYLTDLDAVSAFFANIGQTAQAEADKITSGVQAVLDRLLNRLDELVKALVGELKALQEQLNGLHDRIDDLAKVIGQPLDKARAAIEAIAAEVDAVGAVVDTVIDAINAQIDRLQGLIDIVKNALTEAVGGVDTALTGFKEALAELDIEIEALIPQLRALPDLLDPVKQQIQDTHDLIVEIQERIDTFVIQTDATLNQASNELDQAETRCDEAIAVCTRHMMRSPPLVVARLLFVGVKTSLPGIRTTIATARTTIKSAGKTAHTLLDKALVAIDGLSELLEQAIAKVREVIEEMVKLLMSVRQALSRAAESLDAISVKLHEQIDALCARLDGVVTQVRSAIEAGLARIQAREVVDRIARQVRGLSTTWIDPLQVRIDEGANKTHGLLDTLREQLDPPAQALTDGMTELRAQLTPLADAIQKPAKQLCGLIAKLQADLDEVLQQAAQTLNSIANEAYATLQQGDTAVDELVVSAHEELNTAATIAASWSKTIKQQQAKMQTELDSIPVVDALIDACTAELDQLSEGAQSELDAQCEAASEANAATKIQMSTLEETQDTAMAEAEAYKISLPDSATLQEQVQADLAPTRSEAEAAVETAIQAVADNEQTLAGVDAPWQGMPEEAEAALKEAEDGAKATSEEMQSELAGLAAAATAVAEASQAAEADMSSQCDACHEEVTALRNEAQAEVDAAKADIDSVRAQTEATRADLAKAESIVAAEVARNGGTPRAEAEAQAATSAAPAAATTTTAEAAPSSAEATPTSAQDATQALAKGASAAGSSDTAAPAVADTSPSAPASTASAETQEVAAPNSAVTTNDIAAATENPLAEATPQGSSVPDVTEKAPTTTASDNTALCIELPIEPTDVTVAEKANPWSPSPWDKKTPLVELEQRVIDVPAPQSVADTSLLTGMSPTWNLDDLKNTSNPVAETQATWVTQIDIPPPKTINILEAANDLPGPGAAPSTEASDLSALLNR